MPSRAAIALGSNINSAFGSPTENLHEAMRRLAAFGTVLAVSNLHETEPVGYLDQPRFTNAAAILETEIFPLDLLRELMALEAQMGRIREGVPAKGPRIIDLDLIFYDDLILTTAELTLPHPAMHERAFVLAPLAEIAPNWPHPVRHQTVAQMLANLPPGNPA